MSWQRDLRRLLVGALAEAHAVAAGDRFLDVGLGAVQVGLEDDAHVVVGLAQLVEDVERALRCASSPPCRCARSRRPRARRRAGRRTFSRQKSSEMSSPNMRELDRDVALDLGRDEPQQLLVGLRAAAGRLAVEHVLAQQVEGGLDAAGVELPAGGDGRLGVRPGHEPPGQDERRRDHRRRGGRRARGAGVLPAGAA